MSREPKLYVEDLSHKITPPFLDDETYTKASPAFVIVCADLIFINRARRTFIMAKRAVYAAKDWWTFGGRVKAGELLKQTVVRCLKRETSLDIPTERLSYITEKRYWCSMRQQEPQNAGGDYLAFIFAYEPSSEEITIASSHLDPKEYEPIGLTEFNRAQLKLMINWKPMLDLYDEIFPIDVR